MILVTGATGNIGAALVEQLAAAGVPTRALVRDAAKAGDLAAESVEVVEGDFGDAAALDAALRGVEKVFLLLPGAPNLAEMSNRVVDAAKRAGTVRHIVRSSALGARPDGPVRMWRWHGEGEKYLEASGLAWTHLRPTNFSQGLLQNAGQIKATGAFADPLGDAPLSYVDVRDIAAVARVALTGAGHEGKTYELTGAASHTGAAVAEMLSAETGRPVRYQAVSFEEYGAGARQAGVPPWLADGLVELTRELKAGLGGVVTSAVADVTGEAPIPLERFVRENAAAFRP